MQTSLCHTQICVTAPGCLLVICSQVAACKSACGHVASCPWVQSFEEKHRATGELADMEEVKGWCHTMIHYLQVTVAEVDRAPIAKYSDTE